MSQLHPTTHLNPATGLCAVLTAEGAAEMVMGVDAHISNEDAGRFQCRMAEVGEGWLGHGESHGKG